MQSDPLKKWQPYLARAEELQIKTPLVAYYCRLYVVDSIMTLRKSPGYQPSLDSLLFSTMDLCEALKPSLGNSLGDGELKMEEFCLGVFANADKSDRESPTQPPDVSLAGRFYVASLFFDVMTQFYPDRTLPPDLEEKRLYAKYRTIQIRKRQPIDAAQLAQPPNTPGTAIVPPVSAVTTSTTSATVTTTVTTASHPTGFKYAEESLVPPVDFPVPLPQRKTAAPVIHQTPPTVSHNASGEVSRSDALSAKKKLQQALSAIEFSDYATAVALAMESAQLLTPK